MSTSSFRHWLSYSSCFLLIFCSFLARAEAISITGTVYTDEGVTTIGANKTVDISVHGGAPTLTDETDAGGQFTITSIPSSTGVLTLFIDDETEKAVTIVMGSGSNMTGVHLYQDRLILRSETGSTVITTTHVAEADNSSDADILALFNVDGSSILHMEANKELYVWSGAYAQTTFSPTARIRGHDLEVEGTMNMGTNGLVLTGSLVTANGTFTTSTGVHLLFGYTGAFYTGPETLSMGSNTLQDLVIDNGLVGYWKMDEGRGFTTQDASRYGNHGSLTNMNDGGKKWVAGSTSVSFHNPYSLDFDGTNDYVDAGYSKIMDVGSELSLAAWVKPAAATNGIVMSRMDSTSTTSKNIMFLGESSNVWYFWLSADGTSTNRGFISMTTTPTDNVWSHIAARYSGEGGVMKIFLNGSDVTGGTTGTVPSSIHDDSTVNLHIGRRRFNSTILSFNGLIDDVRMYNRMIGSGEILKLASGNPSSGSGYYILGSALDIDGDLQMYDTKLDVSSTNYAVTVAGDWINQGEFVQRSGSVTLDGSNQAMSGNTVFNALLKSVTSTDTLAIEYHTKQSVSGALTLNGATSNLLSLRTNRSGSAAQLLLDGDTGSQSVEYLDVQDINAAGGITLECYVLSEGCVDSGNNTNWLFSIIKKNYFFFFGF